MLIVLNLVISFAIHGIAWQAHIGGLIAGAALTAAFVYAPQDPPRRRTIIGVAAAAALAVILVVAVVLRNQDLAQIAAAFRAVT
jgi:membrane associated rhomboid family serine protease